jgi:hypothetical protein
MKERGIRRTFIFSFLLLSILGIWFSNLWLILFGLISLACLVYWTFLNNDEKVNKVKKEFEQLLYNNRISKDNAQMGADGLTGIAIIEEEEKVLLFNRTSLDDEYSVFPFNFNQIIESSVKEDGETLIKSSRGSQIGGAIVGSVLAGSVGGIIGGLGASKTSKETTKKINLQIVVDSIISPVHQISFLNSQESVQKDNIIYQEADRQITKWHKIMSVIIKRNELNSKSM